MTKPLSEMTEPEIEELMVKCAKAVKAELGETSMFTLLVFDDPAICQYISTCDREDMIKALRESLKRLEGNEDVTR